MEHLQQGLYGPDNADGKYFLELDKGTENIMQGGIVGWLQMSWSVAINSSKLDHTGTQAVTYTQDHKKTKRQREREKREKDRQPQIQQQHQQQYGWGGELVINVWWSLVLLWMAG